MRDLSIFEHLLSLFKIAVEAKLIGWLQDALGISLVFTLLTYTDELPEKVREGFVWLLAGILVWLLVLLGLRSLFRFIKDHFNIDLRMRG